MAYTDRERGLIDDILNCLGEHYDGQELYNLLSEELSMSNDDIEMLGFDLSYYYSHDTPSLSDTSFMAEMAAAKELTRAAKLLMDTDPSLSGTSSFLCFHSGKQMMSALISLHGLEIIDETGFIEDHWETCKSAFPELERIWTKRCTPCSGVSIRAKRRALWLKSQTWHWR